MYAFEQPLIIPVLEYNEYEVWGLEVQEVNPDTPIKCYYARGQGECHRTTFVFALPER